MSASKRGQSGRKYSGILNDPLPAVISAERKRLIVPATDQEIREGLKRQEFERLKRRIELAKLYEIDFFAEGSGWLVADALARDKNVRGFLVEGEGANAANAPTKWHEPERASLWFAFEAFRENGFTIEKAADEIFNSKELRSFFPAVISAKIFIRQRRESTPSKCALTSILAALLKKAGEPSITVAAAYLPPLTAIIKGAKK